MPDPDARSRARTRGALALAVFAAGLATFASCRAREGVRAEHDPVASGWSAEVARLDSLPALPSALPGREFWIGAWVGPPPAANDAATWRRYAAAGLDVTMVPLEDRYRRADNLARLAVLDLLRAAGTDSILAIVRDDALHPDETTRPGWEARLDSVVAAYAGFHSLAGLMLADEPVPAALAQWAPLARRIAHLDPVHPAYVNFAGLSYAASVDAAARQRWQDDLVHAVEEADLRFFTVDSYPFRPEGETANYLASLRETARASHATARPFGFCLQWTGHGPLHPPTAAEASYAAMQALGHGATSLVWFTYWTPNPREEPSFWHGGAVEYDARSSARHDTLAALDRVVRRVAAWRGPRPMLVVHAGGGLPQGLRDDVGRVVPGVRTIEG
ncbi:MAG: hypothetical protein ABIP29_11415 [Candidatus Eisenbacteria bacterium]